MRKTDLEGTLRSQIGLAKLPNPEEQVALVEGRRFKWDFVWDDYRLAVEVNGATWVKGGHSSGHGLNRDYEKGNLAAIDCWFTMSFSGDQIKSGQALKWLQDFFKAHS